MIDRVHLALPHSVLEEIDCGLLVCDSDGVILYANQAAERELGRSRLLIRHAQRLRSTPDTGNELDGAVAQAAFRGRRTLVTLSTRADRLVVSVVPLDATDTQASLVLVMLGRREPCSSLGLQLLASSCGLTLAETRVLTALTRRATPKEIAVQNAVALSTVRTQIQSLRAKLAERSIEGVLLRTAELPPMAGALRMVTNSVVDAALERADLVSAA